MSLATPKKKIDSKKKKKCCGFGQLKNVANSDTRCDKIYRGQGCRMRIASRPVKRKTVFDNAHWRAPSILGEPVHGAG
jgi:hypothetical protein